MKTKPVFYILIVAAAAFILAMCFSPWAGNSGNLTLVWDGGGRAWTAAPVGDDLSTYNYTVTLKGPGGTIEERFSGGVGSATFDVIPGTWGVTVKGTKTGTAVGAPTVFDYFIMGIEQIEVKAGKKTSEPVTMYNAYEIKDWSDFNYLSSLALGRPMIYLIANDLKADTSGYYPSPLTTANLARDCFFVAEKNVTIGRANKNSQKNFFEITGTTTVTFGKSGMSGTITIDNEDAAISEYGLITFSDGAFNKLVMNDGITIKGGNFTSIVGAAVYVRLGSGSPTVPVKSFIMNGGTITGNHVKPPSGTPFGGGVYVVSGGYFEWNGGTITGNSPDDVRRE
ncbi:MAG: hypothetical protein FWG07_02970 [Treponema sp.]|nr:hypothetical protein [Treponema sp.]